MDMVLSLPDTEVHTDHAEGLCSSMLAHRVENSHSYNSCTLLSHRGSTSFQTPSTSFHSYKNEPRSKVCSNESSFLSHQVSRFLSTPMPPFLFQYQESYSSLHTNSPQNFGPVKRSFEEDDQMVVSLHKKKRLSKNYNKMVSDLLLAVIAEVVTPQDLPESLLVTDETESANVSHLTFLTHQVKEANLSSYKSTLLSHKAGPLGLVNTGLISSPLLNSMKLTTPDMQSLLSHQVVTTPVLPYSSSLLCHQVPTHSVSPHLPSSLLHQVRTVPATGCLTSLLCHQVSHPSRGQNIASFLSHQVVPSTQYLTKLPIKRLVMYTKRPFSDETDFPCKRKRFDKESFFLKATSYPHFFHSFVSHMISPVYSTNHISLISHYQMPVYCPSTP